MLSLVVGQCWNLGKTGWRIVLIQRVRDILLRLEIRVSKSFKC